MRRGTYTRTAATGNSSAFVFRAALEAAGVAHTFDANNVWVPIPVGAGSRILHFRNTDGGGGSQVRELSADKAQQFGSTHGFNIQETAGSGSCFVVATDFAFTFVNLNSSGGGEWGFTAYIRNTRPDESALVFGNAKAQYGALFDSRLANGVDAVVRTSGTTHILPTVTAGTVAVGPKIQGVASSMMLAMPDGTLLLGDGSVLVRPGGAAYFDELTNGTRKWLCVARLNDSIYFEDRADGY